MFDSNIIDYELMNTSIILFIILDPGNYGNFSYCMVSKVGTVETVSYS